MPFSTLTEAGDHLTILARASDEGGLGTLVEALELLGRTGYGADASVGHGGFELAEDPAPVAHLDDVPDADGFTALSTFQPAATDPAEGYWRVFVKYGKLAPEFHASAVFKRPQVMVEAGALLFAPAIPPSHSTGRASSRIACSATVTAPPCLPSTCTRCKQLSHSPYR